MEREVADARGIRPGWWLAAAVLMGGNFLLGVLLFGVPATWVLDPEEGSRSAHLTLLVPAVCTSVLTGAWSIAYYLRGSWRVSPRLLDDLDYGRVEVVAGRVQEAWVVDDPDGTTWLLDLGELVVVVGPPATGGVSPRTFPGRRIELVRCKHSGLVLHWSTDGPPLAPSGRLKSGERVLGIASARYEATLPEVAHAGLGSAA